MGTFLGPFCKDCRHFDESKLVRHDWMDDAQWTLTRINNAICTAPAPDVVAGVAPTKKLEQSCGTMRMGLCGLRGYLFEPKSEPKKG